MDRKDIHGCIKMENLCKTCEAREVCKHAVKSEVTEIAHWIEKQEKIIKCNRRINKDQKLLEAQNEANRYWKEKSEVEAKLRHEKERVKKLEKDLRIIKEKVNQV
jgi:hypothetical protein